MKKALILPLLLLCLTCLLPANTKVIDQPGYEVKKTGIYHIEKIELTDTTARFHIHNTFIPHWWVQYGSENFIIDTKTKKKYNAIGIEGAPFNEKLWMPSSGDSTIVLIFPRLDTTIEKIDFGDEIFGIHIKENKNIKRPLQDIPNEVNTWLNSKLAKTAKKPLTDYNSPLFFNPDTGYLYGYIKGYDVRLGFSTGIIYLNNPFTREEWPIVMKIFPDGRFEAKMTLIHPIYSKINISDRWVSFYLEQGQTLVMILDWEEFLLADRYRNIQYKFKNIEFKGALAQLNRELNDFSPSQFNFDEFQKKLTTLTPSEYAKEQDDAFQKNLKKAENYIAKKKLLPLSSTIIKNQELIQHATALFDFIQYRTYSAEQDTSNPILKQPVPKDYYDFLKSFPLNDKSLFIIADFNWFINRFEYCDPFREIYKSKKILKGIIEIKPEKDLFTFLKDEKITLPSNDSVLFQLAYNNRKTQEEQVLFESKKDSIDYLFTHKYKKQIESLNEKFVLPKVYTNNSKRVLNEWLYRDSVLSNVLGLKPNLVYEVVRTRSLRYDLQGMNREFASNLWDSLKVAINNPFLLNTGTRVLNEMYPVKKSMSYVLAPGTATDIFKAITDSFKGKILLIDFWATSCGPCVSAIKHMKTIREKYQARSDCEFIFITDERSSPLETYNKFVGEQELKNSFRISQDKFNYLRQLFKFNGIPHYALIDKDGNVLNDKFNAYNFEYEINKYLSKE